MVLCSLENWLSVMQTLASYNVIATIYWGRGGGCVFVLLYIIFTCTHVHVCVVVSGWTLTSASYHSCILRLICTLSLHVCHSHFIISSLEGVCYHWAPIGLGWWALDRDWWEPSRADLRVCLLQLEGMLCWFDYRITLCAPGLINKQR